MEHAAINTVFKAAARAALVTALILIIPLLAMQYSDEVAWGPGDFIVAGVLLFSVGFTFALVRRKAGNTAYRAAAGIALAAALFLIWINLGVGVIGDENNSANLMFFGVITVGVIGAIIARFQARGLAFALLATALAQAMAAAIALIGGLGATGPAWPRDILLFTGFFVTLWLLSAWLFWHAAGDSQNRITDSKI